MADDTRTSIRAHVTSVLAQIDSRFAHLEFDHALEARQLLISELFGHPSFALFLRCDACASIKLAPSYDGVWICSECRPQLE